MSSFDYEGIQSMIKNYINIIEQLRSKLQENQQKIFEINNLLVELYKELEKVKEQENKIEKYKEDLDLIENGMTEDNPTIQKKIMKDYIKLLDELNDISDEDWERYKQIEEQRNNIIKKYIVYYCINNPKETPQEQLLRNNTSNKFGSNIIKKYDSSDNDNSMYSIHDENSFTLFATKKKCSKSASAKNLNNNLKNKTLGEENHLKGENTKSRENILFPELVQKKEEIDKKLKKENQKMRSRSQPNFKKEKNKTNKTNKEENLKKLCWRCYFKNNIYYPIIFAFEFIKRKNNKQNEAYMKKSQSQRNYIDHDNTNYINIMSKNSSKTGSKSNLKKNTSFKNYNVISDLNKNSIYIPKKETCEACMKSRQLLQNMTINNS
ncbi:MAG: hypothetical protein MJ252_17990 [archaeon]|nr:hypothetical protein [archaeon]